MNREVHYIFSIQTQDYLKSAWERQRRVYLMISPIAQCRADASGNFRKAVARGDRTAASCLSNLQNKKGLIKRKTRNNNNNNYTVISAGCASVELLTRTFNPPSMQVQPDGLMWVSFFLIISLCIFSELVCTVRFIYAKSSWRAHATCNRTQVQLILWLVMCLREAYIYNSLKTYCVFFYFYAVSRL